MVKRALATDIEQKALAHTGSRTVLFYFSTAFILLLIFTSVNKLGTTMGTMLVIFLSMVCLIMWVLLTLSFKSWKKLGNKTPFLSTSIKVHLLCLLLVSVFASPFVGMLTLNEANAIIKDTPFSLASIISFGYLVLCLLLGVPVFLITAVISDKRKAKQVRATKIALSKNLPIEDFDTSKHGVLPETLLGEQRIYVTEAQVVSWVRKSTVTRSIAHYTSKIGFICKYVFFDQNKILRTAKEFIEKDRYDGKFSSFGVPEAQKQKYPADGLNPETVMVAFNDNTSVIIDK